MKNYPILATLICTLATSIGAAEPKSASDSPPGGQVNLLCSSKIVGASIYNKADEVIADVNSLVLNKEGDVLFVIAGVGGVAGLGESEIAVPWNAIHCLRTNENGSRGCRLQLPMTVEQVKAAPQLKAAHHAELHDAGWTKQNAKYFSVAVPSVTLASGSLISIAKVQGVDVKGPNQQVVGQLDSIVLDLDKAHARYGIISYGGVAGVGKTSTAVPFRSLTFVHNANDDSYAVTTLATVDSIKAGAKVTPHDFPELELKSFRDQIDFKTTLK